MKKITLLFFLMAAFGNLFSLLAAEQDLIQDDFDNSSVYGWYIPADHGTGTLKAENGRLVIQTSGQKDWCMLNREIKMDFDKNGELGLRIDRLPDNITFFLKVERLANSGDFVLLDRATAFDLGNNSFVWDVKSLLKTKSIGLKQDFKVQIVFEQIKGVQTIDVDWVCSNPYFINDRFENDALCGWYIPSDHNTGKLNTGASANLLIETSGRQDWCALNREILIDFNSNPLLAVKIDRLPVNVTFHMKIEYMDDHNRFVLLQPGEATHPGEDAGVYSWNVKKLLSDKSLELRREFKIQIIFEHIDGIEIIAVEFVCSLLPVKAKNDDTAEILNRHNKLWHIIMYGQSLSEGTQSYPALSVEAVDGNYAIGEQVWMGRGNFNTARLAPLFAKPSLEDQYRNFVKDRSSIAKCENSLFGAANHMQKLTNENIGIVATSVGRDGKTIEELSKESQHPDKIYDDFIQSLRSLKNIVSGSEIPVSCPVIFWMQGESNYISLPGLTPGSQCTNDKEAYKSLLLTLKDNMQEDVQKIYMQESKPLFICYQTGAQYIKNEEQSISMAQLEAANQYDDILMAGPVYPMPDRGGHLDPNGYRWFGEMLGKAFYKKYILNEDFRPLQPKRILKESATLLRIEFLVPEPPLVFDTEIIHAIANSGFTVKDSGGNKKIRSIEIDGNDVKITCTTAFKGDIQISYAGREYDGHGSLRDSDPYTGFFTYENLDQKSMSDQYVFERDEDESTLSPWSDPVRLYGERYPLYNFCVHFYYVLPVGETELEVPHLSVSSESVNGLSDTDVFSIARINENTVNVVGGNYEQNMTLKIYDISGHCCQDLYLKREIDISRLANGCYIFRIGQGEKNAFVKFIK